MSVTAAQTSGNAKENNRPMIANAQLEIVDLLSDDD